MNSTIVALITALLGLLFGSSGIYAWFKLGPERRQMTIDVAQGAVVIQSTVLKEIQEQYDRVSDELAQLQMEQLSWKHEQENGQQIIAELRQIIAELKTELKFLRRDFDLTRHRAHIAINALGAYELLMDDILAEMQEHNIPLKPMLRPQKLRSAFQAEMKRLDILEAEFTEEKIKATPPEGLGMSDKKTV